jgi:4-diphosphocytidyl-2-C-methyl-D-erythritol kinase
MTTRRCRARVKALAKINLGLKVLRRRPDGFHELRTIYQSISLADSIDVEFVPSRRTNIELRADVEIPNNLIVRAAEIAMKTMRTTGRVIIGLRKQIPIGAGLGGGSSDAAAVLLALPVLAGKHIDLEDLIRVAGEIGSDVPFFLLGGTAIGIGRGSELYPLPDYTPAHGLIVAPALHMSTREAYRALGRELTTEVQGNMIRSFQSHAWCTSVGAPVEGWPAPAENDFERVAFSQYPQLKSLKRKLLKLGADPAMITGSGSAIFGLFRTRSALEQALPSFQEEKVFRVALVSRARYRSMWWRCLGAHIEGKRWPPQSRYVLPSSTG